MFWPQNEPLSPCVLPQVTCRS